MVSGVSSLPVPVSVVLLAFVTRWGLSRATVSTVRRVGCRLWVYSSSLPNWQKWRWSLPSPLSCRKNRMTKSQSESIQIHPDYYRNRLPADCSGKPFYSHLLFGVVFLMMFIGRVAARKLLMLVGSLGLVGAVGVVFLLAIPKDSDIPFLTVLIPGRAVSSTSPKKKKCRLQIRHRQRCPDCSRPHCDRHEQCRRESTGKFRST